MEPKIVTGSRSLTSESAFISKVYFWMSMGLVLSALGSFWLISQPALLKTVFTNQWLFFGLIIAELGLVMWLSIKAATMAPGLATMLFALYSFLNGVTLTSVLLIYTGASVLTTFGITAGTFLFFSVYGATTKRDLTSVGNIAGAALLGVIIATVVNMFLKSSGMEMVITYLGVAIFMGLIAHDTQKLKAMYAMASGNPEAEKRLAIHGALRIYLDFINLFLFLLRIFGKRRD